MRRCPTTSALVLPGVMQTFILNQIKFSSPQCEASACDGFRWFAPTVSRRKIKSVYLKRPCFALAFYLFMYVCGTVCLFKCSWSKVTSDWRNPHSHLSLPVPDRGCYSGDEAQASRVAGLTLPVVHLHRGRRRIVMRLLSSVTQGCVLVLESPSGVYLFHIIAFLFQEQPAFKDISRCATTQTLTSEEQAQQPLQNKCLNQLKPKCA